MLVKKGSLGAPGSRAFLYILTRLSSILELAFGGLPQIWTDSVLNRILGRGSVLKELGVGGIVRENFLPLDWWACEQFTRTPVISQGEKIAFAKARPSDAPLTGAYLRPWMET
jgi:hypothetical protein